MEGQDLVTLFLGGGGLGALWALARWYLKERMQQQLDERTWQQEVQKRRDELRMERLRYEQQAMNEVFTRFGQLSERMSALIFRLALDVAEDAGVDFGPGFGSGLGLDLGNGPGIGNGPGMGPGMGNAPGLDAFATSQTGPRPATRNNTTDA